MVSLSLIGKVLRYDITKGEKGQVGSDSLGWGRVCGPLMLARVPPASKGLLGGLHSDRTMGLAGDSEKRYNG